MSLYIIIYGGDRPQRGFQEKVIEGRLSRAIERLAIDLFILPLWSIKKTLNISKNEKIIIFQCLYNCSVNLSIFIIIIEIWLRGYWEAIELFIIPLWCLKKILDISKSWKLKFEYIFLFFQKFQKFFRNYKINQEMYSNLKMKK